MGQRHMRFTENIQRGPGFSMTPTKIKLFKISNIEGTTADNPME